LLVAAALTAFAAVSFAQAPEAAKPEDMTAAPAAGHSTSPGRIEA
jgi:hypothetical protein